MAERSYPASKVRASGREELPHARGQGQRPRVPGCDHAGMAMRSYSTSKVRRTSQGGREELPRVRGQRWQPRVPGSDSTGAAERSYPMSEVRGDSQEELSNVQGVVAAWAQEGLEELLHVQGQEGWR